MKKLVLMLGIAFVMVSCSKFDDSLVNQKIVIKGLIPKTREKSAGIKAAEGLLLSDATKVLVFNSSGYELFDIKDSAFTAKAVAGTAPAIAFLDDQNRYIGCLSAGGLNVLPLVSLKDGDKTVIDLSILTLEGTTVIPANDPVGDEINLSDEEIDRYRELGAYYEALSKNIDADNDGLVDLLDKKEFNISTIFGIYCGDYGLNDTPPEVIDTFSIFINYTMRIAGNKALIPEDPNILLTGPESAPYTDIRQHHYATGPDCFITFFIREVQAAPGFPYGSAFLPFAKGTYTVTMDNKNYTLNYSNISAKHFLILALPTVHTNEKDEITSVSVEYVDMNNEPVNTGNFVVQASVWLHGYNDLLCQIGRLWENPEAITDAELYNFTLPEPIPLSQLISVEVGYQDLIGNVYNIGFE